MKLAPGHSGFVDPIIEVSKEDDEDTVNDIVSLDDFPWQHPPELYAIAITGKAFNMLLNDPDSTPILNQVLLKAQIYARMSPDDKAKLVEKL
jgi:cation-transporting ATPase 13A2